jgi:hypothetical protein
VRAHVSLEEEHVFPRIEERLGAEALESSGARMQQAEGDLRKRDVFELVEVAAG